MPAKSGAKTKAGTSQPQPINRVRLDVISSGTCSLFRLDCFVAWDSEHNLIGRAVKVEGGLRCEWYCGPRPANLYDIGSGEWALGVGFVGERIVCTHGQAETYFNGEECNGKESERLV
jgi:hypothetical protein